MIFPLFWLTLISFFSELCETFLCQYWMMYNVYNDSNNDNNG